MLDCTPADFWSGVLVYVLPPAGALLSATALLVASRARSTSQDAQVTLAAVARRSDTVPSTPESSELRRRARDPKK